MDPHRSSYPEEPEPRWFGSQQYPEPEGHARFETHVDEGSHRPRERQGGGRMPPGAPPGVIGQPAQWAGEPRAGVPQDVSQRHSMQHWEPTTTREQHRAIGRPAGSGAVSDGRHQIRRPAAGALIGIAAVIVALPVLRILRDSVFGPAPSASVVISSVLVLLGLPLGGLGLYGLATGATQAPDAPAIQAWLRPPVAYLTVAMVLFVAAGLAAG